MPLMLGQKKYSPPFMLTKSANSNRRRADCGLPYSTGQRCGDACPAVERADVLVYDVLATTESDGGKRLVEGLRDLYPSIPVVLTASGMEFDWVETEGPHGVVPLVGAPTAERLDAAIREALRAPGE